MLMGNEILHFDFAGSLHGQKMILGKSLVEKKKFLNLYSRISATKIAAFKSKQTCNLTFSLKNGTKYLKEQYHVSHEDTSFNISGIFGISDENFVISSQRCIQWISKLIYKQKTDRNWIHTVLTCPGGSKRNKFDKSSAVLTSFNRSQAKPST